MTDVNSRGKPAVAPASSSLHSPGKGRFDLPRTIVLIGMMGAGKSTIGRYIADRLDVEFRDADQEIEQAAGRSIEEIFKDFGEAHFRDGERRVIARLLDDRPFVLATGGGAYMDPDTQEAIRSRAVSLWLKADFDISWRRVSKRQHRPLLKTPDPMGTLRRLIDERYPVYARADITVDSLDVSKEAMGERVLETVMDWFAAHPAPHEEGTGR